MQARGSLYAGIHLSCVVETDNAGHQNVVSKLHFYIATQEKMLYLEPADATE
jgi:hypothetical protein